MARHRRAARPHSLAAPGIPEFLKIVTTQVGVEEASNAKAPRRKVRQGVKNILLCVHCAFAPLRWKSVFVGGLSSYLPAALIERMVSVPDSLPFDQQVNLGEQQRKPDINSTTTTITNTVTNSNAGKDQPSECKALAAQIIQYEAQARQPQSGQMQDWISAQKRNARDRAVPDQVLNPASGLRDEPPAAMQEDSGKKYSSKNRVQPFAIKQAIDFSVTDDTFAVIARPKAVAIHRR